MNCITKRTRSALLAASLLLSLLTVPASAAGSVLDGYTDLDPNDWYAESVEYVLSNGLMTGIGPNTFAPNDTLTRAMVAQILWAMAGNQNVGEFYYGDTDYDTWYSDAVSWVSIKGLMTGYDEGRFGPNLPVTREQMALSLYNYAKMYRYDTRAKGDISAFSDGSSVSYWAEEAMTWAVGAGLISGRQGNLLCPTGTATRAEIAQMFMRFQQTIKN